jgi:glycosyltransferase involved in cell wall biosynthesis
VSRPTVSAVVPTYNRAHGLEEAVSALLADPDLTEAVVVVDGSTDGTVALLREWSESEPRLRPLFGENEGRIRARLKGVRAARGEVVLLLDDDVIAGPGLARGHAEHHSGRERLVVVGYMPVATDGSGGRFPRELYAAEYERHVSAWEESPESILRSFWAGQMSLRRSDYLGLEPQLEAIPDLYHEDLDFGLCCEEAGMVGVFDRSLAATHRYERSVDGFLRDARSSATGMVEVRRRHPDFDGSGASSRLDDLSTPEAAIVRAAAGNRVLRRGMRAALAAADAVAPRRVARRCGNLAWRSEQFRVLSSAG